MQDGFEIVKKKRKRKQKTSNESYQLYYCSKFFIKEKIDKALEEFQSSQFCFEILQEIDSWLKSKKQSSVSEILCYGIGNIAQSKSSAHQLAALLVFQKIHDSAVKIYDPVFSDTEIEFLSDLKIEVLQNEEGKRKIASDEITLVFLPHCPKQLTNNFLWANWNISLANCLIIANSFTKIIEDNTSKVLKSSAGYILKIQPKTQEIKLESSYHLEKIFNDISIHHFTNLDKDFFTKTIGEEPIYSESAEFISKFSSLNIKNE